MRIALGNDHCGLSLKPHVQALLETLGAEVADHGTHTEDPVDFPDIATLVCESIRRAEADRGLMVCGTGVGAAIAANKIPGIRAAVCHETYSARQAVEHDDVNVLCLGAWIVGPIIAEEVIRSFLGARFSTEEHFRRRVAKLAEMEEQAAAEMRGTR
ncbi:MAG: ribose 5-phosphate isomerase B [Streptosporangiales bacterium]|nr:ribose 5-phosphate isomerase B [Streptosporangiales bacterium]